MAVKSGDATIGVVSSGCASPTLGQPIAMAFVESGRVEPGSAVQIDAERATLEGEVCELPFYKAPK